MPNKVTSYNDSILSKLPIVLSSLSVLEKIEPTELYSRLKTNFEDVAEYVEVLDCCFALGKVVLDEDGKLAYVD
ncbi:ABC-three component system middle component 7 [Limosilactobacillus fermentum]|uniref:Uncharacterized protein n=1 Tax=Limosilactobacillus fermentum TaxID=1613 RepID=A0A843QZ93_LIMFE|nr:ABC-three component system middle component 7 [Limosilactobacillus fermentum]MPQ35063.1 hypothetical protein [Limosilactobacillus fermentum]